MLPSSLDESASWFATLSPGVRSDVLLDRPDVLLAEHDLKSANANIGAARAAFFPSISLTAEGGRSSSALSGLFGGGATIWSFAPSITLPIFDGGANRANLAYAEAQRNLFLATYEQTVQTAFKEVADALARRGTLEEQTAAQQALVEAAADTYRISEARYRLGVDTYLNTLDAQRTMYSGRQGLLDIRAVALTNRISLYQVLGGGSNCTTEECL
jgi:multidrug efflux system outer membrane protein